MDEDLVEQVEGACEIMHAMTRNWQNPYFNAIRIILTGIRYNYDIDGIRILLEKYPEERRRASDYRSGVRKEIVPLDERKPSSWMWRQNPYEFYEPTGPLENSWYSPADFVTAYNLYQAIVNA